MTLYGLEFDTTWSVRNVRYYDYECPTTGEECYIRLLSKEGTLLEYDYVLGDSTNTKRFKCSISLTAKNIISLIEEFIAYTKSSAPT